ncbi:MAG: DNA polymerase III subunit alpha [Polyangia bacterium]
MPTRSPYVELRCQSAFSFLRGVSLPEALIERAAALGYSSIALADRAGMYAAPRLHKAAQQHGLRPIFGAEVTVAEHPLLLLCEDARGYRNLCRLITRTKQREPSQASLSWETLAAEGQGLFALTGGSEGAIGQALGRGAYDEADDALQRLIAALGPDHVAAELQLHFDEEEDRRNGAVVQLGRAHRLPLVLTNDVRMAAPEQQLLCDALTCVREGVQLEHAGTRLLKNGERYLKGPQEMAALLPDLPQAVENTVGIAERCQFSMKELSYRFPDFPLPPGEDQIGFLRAVVYDAAPTRFRPLGEKARAQIERELKLIDQLGLAGYFLIVWDIIQFCKSRGILVQGRGSAANSAVCFALGITAVDPLKMDLLFERFLSEERGEWPDIDLDLPSGSRREEVIQYLYRKYGAHACALTAVVISYRERSALRDLGKVLGFDKGALDRISRHLHRFGGPEDEDATGEADARDGEGDPERAAADGADPAEAEIRQALREAGMDPADERLQLLTQLYAEAQELPRHIGQHPGGMVIAAGRLDEVVPLEPARMPGRVVLQWDKDDCADLGMVKIDLLGLGMMAALEEATHLVPLHDGAPFDIAALPPDDPEVYRLLKRADTVGMFQVESRAQQRVLSATQPDRFYDLVVQVGLIRPGPIVGKMVGPYIRRRIGSEPIAYPHPSLQPILERTLGVPLFQEQVMKMAMVAAGFTGGQAELLRRAMDSKRGDTRKEAKMRELVGLLREGLQNQGMPPEAAAQIEHAITSFAQYGFPESHAISFAILAYASAYLKAHHPAVFYTSLLNAWPMGFYHPSTLLHDARRHGVRVLPIDVNHSKVLCTIEHPPDREHYHWSPELPPNVVPLSGAALHQRPPRGASPDTGPPSRVVRLGLRFVRGLSVRAAEALVREQPFQDLADVRRRCPELTQAELLTLAEIGAFAGLPDQPSRREALWQVSQLAQSGGPLLQRLSDDASPLAEMSLAERVLADLEGTGVTVGPHPLRLCRPQLAELGAVTAERVGTLPHGTEVRVAGLVIVRQRPATARGAFFLTMEDESGLLSATVSPQDFGTMRPVLISATGLLLHGTVDVRDGARSLRVSRCYDLGQVLSAYGATLRPTTTYGRSYG